MSRVIMIISALVICIIVCLSWAVNHYRDNGHLQSPARQKCQRTEAGERGNTTCRCVSVMLLPMQNTKELADAKAEKMPGRDDAAGRRRLQYQRPLVSA